MSARVRFAYRAVLALVVFVMLFGVRTDAYLKLGTGTGASLKWNQMPVRYFVTNRDVDSVSAVQLQSAVGRAFAKWQAVDTAVTSSEFVGFTALNPVALDGSTVIGFVNRPDLDRTLGATSFTFDINGNLVASDIFLNSTFSWSTADTGAANRFDVESIALHEIGHLLGLAHSALGETELIAGGGRRVIAAEAVMFPIAFSVGSTIGRTLRADDIAGITDLYPADRVRRDFGSMSGRVTKNGQGVLGAHLNAYNPRTGKIVAGFTLNQEGRFDIAALDPGTYVVRVEPLDDADIGSFFDTTLNIDINFKPKIYEKLVVVPRGGGTSTFEIKVVPK
jgi:hypothetical protein